MFTVLGSHVLNIAVTDTDHQKLMANPNPAPLTFSLDPGSIFTIDPRPIDISNAWQLPTSIYLYKI